MTLVSGGATRASRLLPTGSAPGRRIGFLPFMPLRTHEGRPAYLAGRPFLPSLASVLDHANNVTCLGPTDQAFLQAGSPDENAAVSDLSKALLVHTLTEPAYIPFLTDGQAFQTVSNDTVIVSIRNGSIYFNDALLTQGNVL